MNQDKLDGGAAAFRADEFVTVTDIKEMGYCPRIVYYHYCLPGLQVPSTFKMQMGSAANAHTEELEHRRSLRAYGLETGQREYDVWLESAALGLRGRLDMLIRTPHELVPVDYKDSAGQAGHARGPRSGGAIQHNWQLQLTAYAMLLEQQQATLAGAPLSAAPLAVRRGFLYFIPARRAYEVEFKPELRAEVSAQLGQMRIMIRSESMPEPVAVRQRCLACEYRRFCNDV